MAVERFPGVLRGRDRERSNAGGLRTAAGPFPAWRSGRPATGSSSTGAVIEPGCGSPGTEARRDERGVAGPVATGDSGAPRPDRSEKGGIEMRVVTLVSVMPALVVLASATVVLADGRVALLVGGGGGRDAASARVRVATGEHYLSGAPDVARGAPGRGSSRRGRSGPAPRSAGSWRGRAEGFRSDVLPEPVSPETGTLRSAPSTVAARSTTAPDSDPLAFSSSMVEARPPKRRIVIAVAGVGSTPPRASRPPAALR